MDSLFTNPLQFAVCQFLQGVQTNKCAGDKFNYTEIKDAIVETMNEDIVIPEPATLESAEEEIENEINLSRNTRPYFFVKISIWLILLYVIIMLVFNGVLNQIWLSKGCFGLPLSDC